MANSQSERDYNDQGALKRPGRLDFRTLNNEDDVGDGHPGVQKCFRNYLHEGYIEKDLHLNSKNITNVGDVDGVDVSEVSLSNQPTAATGNIDCGTQDVTNVGNVDGIDISAIAFDNMPTAPSGDIPVNSQQITGLADAVDPQDAQAFGQKYTNGEADTRADARIVVQNTHPGGSIDVAVDALILNHKNIATAHHTATVAGDLNHNDLANINAGTDNEHLTQTQVDALHAIYTDASARSAIGDIFTNLGVVNSVDIDFDGNGINNLDNINDNIYFCSTSAEIQAAIDAIGAGAGTIILESGTITVDTVIDIDPSGSVVIQGQGESTILDASVNCFNITSITSCVLRDFRIDGTHIGAGVYAIIIADTKVLIDNVYINLPTTAKGINITTSYNTLSNCSFSGGLPIVCSGHWNNIIVNSMTTVNITGSYVMSISGDYNTINGNKIYDSSGLSAPGPSSIYGIYLTGDYNTINGNILKSISAGASSDVGNGGHGYGIYLTGDYNSINDNILNDINGGEGGFALAEQAGEGGVGIGICISSTGSYNTINGNNIDNIDGGVGGSALGDNAGNGGTGVGINIGGTYNTTIGNNISNVQGRNGGSADDEATVYAGDGGDAYGIYCSNANNIINSNITKTIDGGNGGAGTGGGGVEGDGGDAFGVYLTGASCVDCTVSGNNGDDMDGGTGDSAGTGNGIGDADSAAYSIWTNNNYRGEGESVGGTGNVESLNLT